MDSHQEYTPKSIQHISMTLPKARAKVTPKSEQLIILRRGHTLRTPEMALIGGRMIDLHPVSLTSTVLSNRDFVSILIYLADDITEMDATVFAYSPSYPQSAENPKYLMHTRVTCYTELIPLLDAAMTTVLRHLTEDPKGIWP